MMQKNIFWWKNWKGFKHWTKYHNKRRAIWNTLNAQDNRLKTHYFSKVLLLCSIRGIYVVMYDLLLDKPLFGSLICIICSMLPYFELYNGFIRFYLMSPFIIDSLLNKISHNFCIDWNFGKLQIILKHGFES